jgi:hypothetical protein
MALVASQGRQAPGSDAPQACFVHVRLRMRGEEPIAGDLTGVPKRVRWLARLLDSSIPLPGLRFRIGVDPILGLFPGVGDTIGALVAMYFIREAARLGAPASVMVRMALNVAIDAAVGVIPIIGNVFDAVWKANMRNVALLEAHATNPRRTAASSMAFVILVSCLMLAFILAVAVAGFLILRALWNAIV